QCADAAQDAGMKPEAALKSTNYLDTFIAVAPDCPATQGTEPKDSAAPSIARRTFTMIRDAPYVHTSDDVIFTVFADRTGIPPHERSAARKEFFSKGRACLRASDLGKRYGWGIHSDAEGRVALYGMESPEYRTLASGEDVTVTYAMRSKRKQP
ncbi:MAG TPA: DUF6157 family protein, partial [Vulgatibacter sp.]